jgi:hypothetical protein
MMTIEDFASREQKRARRGGKWFSVVRVAPVGWGALDEEVEALTRIVEGALRRTDFVQRRRDREVGVVLVETSGSQLDVPLARIRKASALYMPDLRLLVSAAPVEPGRQWEEAWRWAGELLLANAAVPAAA